MVVSWKTHFSIKIVHLHTETSPNTPNKVFLSVKIFDNLIFNKQKPNNKHDSCFVSKWKQILLYLYETQIHRNINTARQFDLHPVVHQVYCFMINNLCNEGDK